MKNITLSQQDAQNIAASLVYRAKAADADLATMLHLCNLAADVIHQSQAEEPAQASVEETQQKAKKTLPIAMSRKEKTQQKEAVNGGSHEETED